MSKADQFINQTYSQLAEQTGIAPPAWSRYFNGKQFPNMNTIRNLARLAQCSDDEMVKAVLDRRSRHQSTD